MSSLRSSKVKASFKDSRMSESSSNLEDSRIYDPESPQGQVKAEKKGILSAFSSWLRNKDKKSKESKIKNGSTNEETPKDGSGSDDSKPK